MKFREFELSEDITQLEYITFRTRLESLKPEEWNEVTDLPVELFYDTLTRSAVEAGWVQDIVEKNEYGEEETFVWKESGINYINNLPAGPQPITKWGGLVFDQWVRIRQLDPN